MRARIAACGLFLLLLGWALAPAGRAQADHKDYLSESEANQIRDAETTSERIKLFLNFATDRLKKFDYELHKKTTDQLHAELLNTLLDEYSSCLDDAADRIQDALDRQEDIRGGIKEMTSRVPKFLEQLQKLEAGGPDLNTYKDTLADALESTRDALDDARKAEKEIAPPPTARRKP